MQVQKNTFIQKKGGCNITVFFFLWACVLQNVKSYRFFFGIFFFCIFWLFFKKHYKNRHFSTFFEAKNYKKNGIFESYYLVQVDCVLKNANLDQIITSNIFARNFFQKKRAETPIFIVFLAIGVLEKNKLGPDSNFQKGQTWTR